MEQYNTDKNHVLLDVAAREDIRCHLENGVSLNPYSTDSSRNSWQNGFDKKFPGWDYTIPYQRGRRVAELMAIHVTGVPC